MLNINTPCSDALMLKEAKTIQGQLKHMSEGLPEFRQNTVLTLCVCVG